jgi:hypothetical protein
MMEASLRMWAQNMTAMATTGRFVDDPPDIAALFAQARARYLQAATRYPAAYRKMQQSFSLTFALLMESAAPGLAHYARQPDLSPDVIGQVFMTCLEPGPAWAQFFPPWAWALEQAETALPDGSALVYQRLVEAALVARARGETVILEPGENFVEWFETVQPYFEPLIIGPALIDSSVMMLATATRFQPWMVDLKLVEFYWTADIDPLLVRMARLNAMLYNLNGYLLEHVQAGARITAYLEAHGAVPDVDLIAPDLSAGLNTNPPPAETDPTPSPSPPESPPGPSFADLFRQPNVYHDKEHTDDE